MNATLLKSHIDIHPHPPLLPLKLLPQGPRRQDAPPPRRDRNYNKSITEFNLSSSMRVLGLKPGASVREVNVRYQFLARRLHPSKHDPEEMGMTSEEAVE